MSEAEYRLKKLEDQKQEEMRKKRDNELQKKLDRERSVQTAFEMKQKQVFDL